MEKDFDYYAFISYHRKDEKWAKWLQNKLISCKLPAIFRKGNADLPKYIRPVFRDKTYMEAGPITDILQEKLERSKYLIVICSPEAAKSKWIGIEIDAFIEMGRSDRIIPFIVDGVPHSCDSRECLHPLIKGKIPDALGININEIGKQKAFLKVAAKILNLNLSELWHGRGHIPQRKRRLVAAIAGLLCLAALGLVWHYHSPKKAYFDADDKPFEEGHAKVAYKYDEQGNVTEEAYFDTDGKPCMAEFYYATTEYNSYAKITLKYDEQGNVIETAYFDTDGRPHLLEANYAKATSKYDSLGNLTEEAFFDTNGEPCMAENGFGYYYNFRFAKITYKYNGQGEKLETAYFDTNGNMIAFFGDKDNRWILRSYGREKF